MPTPRRPILLAILAATLQLPTAPISKAAPPDQPPPAPARQEDHPRPRPPGLQDAIDQLHLTADKRTAVDAIVAEYHQKELQAKQELLANLKETLTPEQFESFGESMSRHPGPPPNDAPASVPAHPPATPPASQPAAVLNPDGSSQVPLIFEGGHDTDPRDGGRPIILIAAALDVPAEIFRKAFSGVTPAAAGQQPEEAQVRLNKAALMRVLGPYGVTDARLNEVSNYYRYSRSQGQSWRHAPAAATATIRDGRVTAITITDHGSGYSSPPKVSIPLLPNAKVEATLAFDVDFKSNGSIRELKLVP